jgi:transposase
MNADAFIDFMKNLVRGAKQKIFLIVDRLPAHKAQKVREWVDANREHIQLFYLPPYSPELNPDEWVNRDLKTELRTRPATNHTGTLKGMAYRFMTTLESSVERVARYFRNWHVTYAGSMQNMYSV